MFGLEVQGVTEKLWLFAQAELEDTKLLVEKITALGGDPTTKVGELVWRSTGCGAPAASPSPAGPAACGTRRRR